ncbi:MAG TPA: HAD family hydrolase [Balneolales bacterium]|nr:HAD family hydrolase [Balneolales bacterium]
MNRKNHEHTKLFLFDIDGTLLSVKKGFMHDLIERLLIKYEMSHIDISKQYFAGRTDRDIFSSILKMGRSPVDESFFQAFKKDYIQTLKRELLPAYVRLIDYVKEAIEYIAHQNFHYGLLTGNFRESAFIKLQNAGIDQFFNFGVFGTDHADRNRLPAIAHKLAEQQLYISLKPKDLIIIGDTPKDIDCARQYGATSIAVATGSYTREELSRYQPDYLFNNLSKPNKWLQIIN